MKKRIAIILELKHRELPYFYILKKKLEEQGNIVRIFSFRLLSGLKLILFRPNVIIVNGLRSDQNFIKQIYVPKKLFNTAVVCAYSEQIHGYDISMAYTYDNAKILENVDVHVVWGNSFAKDIEELGVNKEKIWICGALQNDLPYYLNMSDDELKTNLAGRYGLNSQKEWCIIADNIIYNSRGGADELYRKRRKDFDEVIELAAKRIPNVEFILRPHPETSLLQIKEMETRFARIKNVHVINGGHIFQWCHLCRNMLISFSTSSVMSLLEGRQVFSFKLEDANEPRVWNSLYWHQAIIPIYGTAKALVDDLELDFAGLYTLPENIAEKRERFLQDWYDQADGYVIDRYANLLREVCSGMVDIHPLSDFKPSWGSIVKAYIAEIYAFACYVCRGRLGRLRVSANDIHEVETIIDWRKPSPRFVMRKERYNRLSIDGEKS